MQAMITTLLLVGCGGFLGSISRFFIASRVRNALVGTWFANVSGAVLLGMLLRFYVVGDLSESLWLFAGVGFSGAYTTFSTFGKETISLLLEKRYVAAIWYVTVSFACSFLLVMLIV